MYQIDAEHSRTNRWCLEELSFFSNGNRIATGTAGTASAESTSNSGRAASYAFNGEGDRANYYCGASDGSPSDWLRYDFGTPTAVDTYNMYPVDQSNTRPHNWVFQGSNDGSNWVTLDTQTGQSIPARGQNYEMEWGCRSCAAGQYASALGATACDQCGSGQAASADRIACVDCAAGQYSAEQQVCTACEAGQYASALGATACQVCLPGKVSGYSADAGASSANVSGYRGATSCVGCTAGNQVLLVCSAPDHQCYSSESSSRRRSSYSSYSSPAYLNAGFAAVVYVQGGTRIQCATCPTPSMESDPVVVATVPDQSSGRCTPCPEDHFMDERVDAFICTPCDGFFSTPSTDQSACNSACVRPCKASARKHTAGLRTTKFNRHVSRSIALSAAK